MQNPFYEHASAILLLFLVCQRMCIQSICTRSFLVLDISAHGYDYRQCGNIVSRVLDDFYNMLRSLCLQLQTKAFHLCVKSSELVCSRIPMLANRRLGCVDSMAGWQAGLPLLVQTVLHHMLVLLPANIAANRSSTCSRSPTLLLTIL